MRSVGEATAAVSVVNALPTGIGAAIGIELRARAELTAEPSRGADAELVIQPQGSETRLVREATRRARAAYPIPEQIPVRLEVSSEIPQGRGLKSSSAVASAIVLAFARAAGAPEDLLAIARISADTARSAGVSATGAFDDALAGLVGGLVVTDNVHDRLVRAIVLDPALQVGVWIPSGTHPPSPETHARFRQESVQSHAAVEAVLRDDWPAAMDLNSDLVERVMGYPYRPLREEARRRGAIAAGTSGLGPAFAVLAPKDRISSATAHLSTSEAELRTVNPSQNPPLPIPGAP